MALADAARLGETALSQKNGLNQKSPAFERLGFFVAAGVATPKTINSADAQRVTG
jgi:hypothetical protein